MAKSIIIHSTTTTGKATTTAVTNVNPNATNSEMVALAQGLNGLTKNNYSGATLVEKTELVNKPQRPNLALKSGLSTTTTITHAKAKDNLFELYQDGVGLKCADAYPVIVKNTTDLAPSIAHFDGTNTNGDSTDNISLYILPTGDYEGDFHTTDTWKVYDANGNLLSADGNGEIVLRFPETTQYAQTDLVITVTA